MSGFFARRREQKEARARAEAARRVEEQQAEAMRDVAGRLAAAEEVLLYSRLEHGVSSVDGVLLKKGEQAYLIVQGAALIEPRRQPGKWVGGSQGVSFRIAKGVTYRVGASRGTYQQGEEKPTIIDEGTFVVTNQRCLFTGSKRTTEWAYSKLLGFSLDGVGVVFFNVSNRQKTSGVVYGEGVENKADATIAAAIAAFRGPDEHKALITELTQEVAQLQSMAS